VPYVCGVKQTHPEKMNNNNNTEIQIVNEKCIYLTNSEWGWYIQLSDGYVSDYFSTKKEAIARRAEIKTDIKKGLW
jgi:hypothetical protein